MVCMRVGTVAAVVILAWGPWVAAQTTVTLFFDPADFYDFRPLGPGPVDDFSTEGGMFKLHEIWDVTGPPEETLRSWLVSDRQRVDDWSDALSSNDIVAGPEGIGFFNIDLANTANGQSWGQTMSTPLSIDLAIAPPGWTAEIDGNRVAWTPTNAAFIVRPDTTTYDDGRSFGVRFSTNDAIPLGSEQTIWVGGFNWVGSPRAVNFGSWGPPGFASVDALPGSGFEATRRLVRDFIETDFDNDGDVDGDDFLAWQGGFGTTSGATQSDGDADFDGDVDGDDFLIWQSQLGTSLPGNGSASVAAVPEPTTSMLLLLTGFLLARVRRRK